MNNAQIAEIFRQGEIEREEINRELEKKQIRANKRIKNILPHLRMAENWKFGGSDYEDFSKNPDWREKEISDEKIIEDY